MDFTKDIYLNIDKLYENSSLIILYNGFLSKEPENKVYLNYGYNDNWERNDELKLKRTEKGMLGVIRVSSGNTFQFVFRNDYNQWDNNNNANYIIPIYEKEETILDFGPEDLKQVVTDISQEVTTENVSDTHDANLIETSIYSSSETNSETFNSNQSSQNTSESTINKFETENEGNTTKTYKETDSTTTMETESTFSQESAITSTAVNTVATENTLNATLSSQTLPEDTYQTTADTDSTTSNLEVASSLETENNTNKINKNEVKEVSTYATNTTNTETAEAIAQATDTVNTVATENTLNTNLSSQTLPEDTYQATTDTDSTTSILEAASSLETENNTNKINENEVKEVSTYATTTTNTETAETDSTTIATSNDKKTDSINIDSELSETQQAIKKVFMQYTPSASQCTNIKNTITRPTTFSIQSVENTDNKATNGTANTLGSEIYTTNEITFENTYKIESSSLPKNTLVNKIVLDDATNTYFIKRKLISTPIAEQLKLTQEFSNFAETLETNPSSENKAQTSTQPKEISPSTPRVEIANQAVKDFSETQNESTKNTTTVAKSDTNETISTALVTSSAAKLSAKSTLYLLKRRVKLAYIKLLKVVKSVFNLDTNENK